MKALSSFVVVKVKIVSKNEFIPHIAVNADGNFRKVYIVP